MFLLRNIFPPKSLFDMRSAVQLRPIFPPKNLEKYGVPNTHAPIFLKNSSFVSILSITIYTHMHTNNNTVSHILLLLIQSIIIVTYLH